MNNEDPKRAVTDHPIHDFIAQRWSPYVFDARTVEKDKLLSCLEAARWSASSYNEQPWSFLVAEREDEDAFATMLSCLVEANQAWAKDAGVLMLTIASTTFQRNGKPNNVAVHDIGLASANLTFQATALGLGVHQMAGFNASKARATYGIPDGYDPVTAIAIGYVGASNEADDEIGNRDSAPRSRKPLSEFVFTGKWQTAWK